jgi:hypothetical protein
LKEGSLWTEVDLRKYNKSLSLEDLKNLIKRYGCESTKVLMLYGVFNQDCLARKIENFKISQDTSGGVKKSSLAQQEKIFYLDEYFMNEVLVFKCPNLKTISLEYLDLSHLNIGMFLSLKSLTSLYIKWCNINENWFQNSITGIKKENNLKDFYLIKTGTLSHLDIIEICNIMPNLTSLSISQANSTIKNDSVDVIVEKLLNLEKLELVNTLIDDDAILKICNSAQLKRSLTHLNISMSSSITNSCLKAIGDNLTNIKSLYLTSCFGISDFNLLLNLVKLEYLNVNNTSIIKEHIRNVLVPMLPNCEIEYGHEKILNKKLTWTINGSRNSVCSF